MANVQHIYKGTTAPATAPAEVGHHYIDTVAKKAYLSVGTATSADWLEVGALTFPIQSTTNGTVSAPSIRPGTDNDSGFYSSGDGNISFAANGTHRLSIDQNNSTFTGDLFVTGNLDVTGDIIANNYPPTGGVGRLAYYDLSGDLSSVASWGFENDYEGLTYGRTTEPVDDGGHNIVNVYMGFDPQIPSPTDNWRWMNVFLEFDVNNTGNPQGTNGDAATVISTYVKNVNTGQIGRVTHINFANEFGNGTDPLTIDGINMIVGTAQIRSGVEIDGSLNGYHFSPNMESGSTITGGVQAFSDFSTITSVQGYISFSSNPNIAELQDASAYEGFRSAPNITSLLGGYFGLGVFANIDSLGPNASFQGVNVNPTIDDANDKYVAAININLDQVAGTTSLYSINAIGGIAAFNGKAFQCFSELDTSVDAIPFPFGLNQLGGTFTIAAGSPITGGAFGILNNLGVAVVAEDDMPPDGTGLGLGLFMNGSLTQLGVSPGKTVDSLSFMGAGASVPATYGGGTITTVNMFRALGVINQGDSITIDEMRGFYVDTVLSSLATDAWGFRVDDVNAENHFEKSICIGTASKKVSNADIALEIGSKKQLVLAVMTTTERDAMTAVTGALIFNSTLGALQYFDGSVWV